MKETIVYLPVSRNASGMFPDVLVFSADEVVAALEAAGIKWTQESPEEHQIRMLKLQIDELKLVCTKLQRDLKEAQAENGSLAGLLTDEKEHVEEIYATNEALRRAYLEIQDENAVLKDRNAAQEKTTIRHLGAMGEMDDENEKLKQAYLELQDQNAALKMTAGMAQEELKALRLAGHYGEGKS